MNILIGYTGFVGSNIHSQYTFDEVFNSKNIQDAFGINPDLCVYAGVRAEKFLANKEPYKDLNLIKGAIENIKKINPKRLVLISTIDVFKNPNGKDEDSTIDTEGLHPYGFNRHHLEKWVSENIENYHIVRLPGLFGKNIKKNFIYDLINFLPSILSKEKYTELSAKEMLISKHYIKQENGFYKCKYQSEVEHSKLINVFTKLGFSSHNFTDSRGIFQFYNLTYLWKHIQIVIKENIKLLHLAVEPSEASEIYKAVTGMNFINQITLTPPIYDFKTKYANLWGGGDGYIFNKKKVLDDIIKFVKESKK